MVIDLLSVTFYEKDSENANNLIDMILKNYNDEDIIIKNEISRVGNSNTIYFYINEDIIGKMDISYNDFVNMFKHYASVGISSYIIDILEPKIIEKIIHTNYYFLKPDEKKFIMDQFNTSLDNEIYDKNIDVPYKVNRKAKILYKLVEFLSKNSNLNIEGFVNFRLGKYLEDLYEIIDRVIEEYMMKREYNEFIKLLKYFVNIQEPKMDLINIIVDANGGYHFLDGENRIIDDEYIRGLIDDLIDNNLNNDDLLISSLITIAPRKIVFHFVKNVKNTEIIETIKNIFDGKVYICDDCKICKIPKNIRGE
ncbi:putative sporulation protein YtxC [Maledivibacter halophilus]|uniref:Putative sporulation protein YtxC n=1 Tax=Maledivibacter halophilus TaxID=36842 RepID=A0A1T5IWV6_9FIRM|nr:putative sporulation protein YtxC [Maledivibacter halophilus]SKC43433.1 putative sporulation protein YtxC [Maledivibacter halophilus]